MKDRALGRFATRDTAAAPEAAATDAHLDRLPPHRQDLRRPFAAASVEEAAKHVYELVETAMVAALLKEERDHLGG